MSWIFCLVEYIIVIQIMQSDNFIVCHNTLKITYYIIEVEEGAA